MPARLSKFTIESVTCKECTHPWIESCLMAQVGLGLHALQESLRIYSTVYFIALLMRRRVPSKDDIFKTLFGILQSTAFLTWSSFTYPLFICVIRKLLGNFNIITVSFLPSFLSSLLAIVIERPSRRTMLCLYVANIATETIFRMGVFRGYFKVIPHGNLLIFAVSMATLLFFFRSKFDKHDSIFRIIKFMVGPYEDPGYATQCLSPEQSTSRSNRDSRSNNESVSRSKSFDFLREPLRVYQNFIEWIKNSGKNISCPHPESCSYFILGGTVKLFSIGLCTQLCLKLAFQIRKLMTKPSIIKSEISKKDNYNLAFFLAGFGGIYRLVSCLLRRSFNKDSRTYAIPAGLLASVAFLMFPNNTIALYVMWKALQLSWNKGVESGKLPEVKWFVIFLYCVSTAILFHAAIVEPHNLRSSYWKFLYNLSGGRLAAMARGPLDPFGLESSKHLQEVLKKNNMSGEFHYQY